MLNFTRIKRLYLKDLLDILRDRRMLITLVAVPIVLYPGLMLCFIQMGSIQAGQIRDQQVRIGYSVQGPDEPGAAEDLKSWLNQVLFEARDLARSAEEAGAPEPPPALQKWSFEEITSGDLKGAVQEGRCLCAVQQLNLIREGPWQRRELLVFQDSTEIRSTTAAQTLENILKLFERRQREEGLREVKTPEALIHPLNVDVVDVASAVKRGGSLLGEILPLVLVLMTITGAIYPAIDLTAGERERGTLETLMVCPVPVIEIIMGKFLVVATVSMFGAALNLGSMGLTIQFGGLREALSAGADTQVPIAVLPVILLCLVPLSILFSALLLAVSSFARSFKEAQSYVTPVIMGVLLPAGMAALPGTELTGAVQVMPVGNMVLLTRELLMGTVGASAVLAVVLSTCFYAAAAVAIAVRIFGQEAVLFADAGSWRAQFDRNCIQPSEHPRSTLPLMYVALLFPIWLYLQNGLQRTFGERPHVALIIIQATMVLLFAFLPWMLVLYYKINSANAFSLRWPRPRFLLAALLVGLGSWGVAHELVVLQARNGWFGLNEGIIKSLAPLQERLVGGLSLANCVLLLAVLPAFCEEFLFRGLLLSGLRQALGRGWSIAAVAVIFAIYHFTIQRFVVTFLLGALLAWLCWQSRSLLPAVIVHLMHNGIGVVGAHPDSKAGVAALFGLPTTNDVLAHLPMNLRLATAALVVAGILLSLKRPAPEGITDGFAVPRPAD
jgi:ABC-2 type transport system permease protein/sodium transport system permease protein